MTPRFKKLGGDIVDNQGRLFMMSAAIAVGVFTVATIATAYAVLSREIDRDYLTANPPAALIEVFPLDDAAVAGVKRQDGIAWAEARGSSWSRVEVRPGEWLPLLLFVVPDFGDQRISRVDLTQGRWAYNAGELVIERTAMSLAQAALAREIKIQTADGSRRTMTVTGVVHDPSVAPAIQQQVVYGYITQATSRLLGGNIPPHRLDVTVHRSGSRRDIQQVVVGAAQWLQRSGYRVGEIRIPPRHHPHWAVMSSIVRMLLAFGVLTLVLSALLSAMLTASLLSPQVRQIGIMKAIGARTGQIMLMYLGLVAAIGVIAVAIGLPAGIYAGSALASFVARNQNIDLSSVSAPVWIYLAVVGAGVGIPLMFTAIPIRNAARRTARESLFDVGVAMPAFTPTRFASFPCRFVSFPCPFAPSLFPRIPVLALAVRNSFRRRARLASTVGLLAAAGALFVASVNILSGWEQGLVDARSERHYDIEIQLRAPQSMATLQEMLKGVPNVRRIEVFNVEAAAPRRRDGLTVTAAFPDGEHGSLHLEAIPADSAFITPRLIAGRWLTTSDRSGAVLNNQALAFFPGIKIGGSLNLTVRGHPVSLRLTGMVREHLAGATIYMMPDDYPQRLAQHGFTGGLRLGIGDKSEASEIQAMAAAEHTLEDGGAKVAGTTSRSGLGRALAAHLYILIFILIVMSVLMALVGMFGLATMLASGVLERGRELAVLRTLGAGHVQILFTVICEGVFITFLSVIAAAVLSVPVTILVANLVGEAMLGPWQGVVVSPTAVPLWLVVVLLSATIASVYPAHKASRTTIREALTYP